MINKEYLNNKEFLKQLDLENYKTQFTRIVVLDFKTELPIAFLEGKATGGSCTMNGASSSRRAANCSLLVDPQGIQRVGYSEPQQYDKILDVNNLISIGKKIRLETGFLNTLSFAYPEYGQEEIIWFPLGVYVIKNASISSSASGINISLTLNDKSTLLNGEMGGIFPAGVILSEVEEYLTNKDGSIQRISKKLLIKDIIRYIVTEFGGENPSNILITDIPDTIVKVMKWIGDSSLYHLRDEENKSDYFLLNELEGLSKVAKYEHGQDVCYMNEPFVYPGKLECDMGDSVATALDKIKNTLGNFEWFYDVNGKFVFQEKKNYLNTSFATSLLNISQSDYRIIPNLAVSSYTFDKKEKSLLSSISNNPQFQNIKNDFTVWGVAKTATGVDKPIRYRVVLGTKPEVKNDRNWLALVYTDYRNLESIILLKEEKNYQILEELNREFMVDKKVYYIYKDEVYCWFEDIQDFAKDTNYKLCYLKIPAGDWRTQLYFEGLYADKQTFAQYPYAAELKSEWPKIYQATRRKIGFDIGPDGNTNIPIYVGGYRDRNTSGYDYWLDILEGSPFDVDIIGRRQKVVNGKDINCLLPTSVPNFVLIEASGNTEEAVKLANEKKQEVVQVSSKVFNNLTLGGGYNSAFEKIKELLYIHTNYSESISLSTIPIYYLEPNTRITVNDEDTSIAGDYLIKSISLPLDYNGISSISATRCPERIDFGSEELNVLGTAKLGNLKLN